MTYSDNNKFFDANFSEMRDYILDYAIEELSTHDPEAVFTIDILEEWALGHGFVKEDE